MVTQPSRNCSNGDPSALLVVSGTARRGSNRVSLAPQETTAEVLGGRRRSQRQSTWADQWLGGSFALRFPPQKI
eukprot:2303891-Amphidinium_carterae.1